MISDHPQDWKLAAGNMGAFATYAISEIQGPLAYEAARSAGHYANLYLRWLEVHSEDDTDPAIPCVKCRSRLGLE